MTDETKEFASIEDATPTTAIPSETDATTATTTMVTVDDRTDTTACIFHSRMGILKVPHFL